MRYFYVSYSAKNGQGACTVTASEFINNKKFIKGIIEVYPNLVNPCINTWVEMTEEDYLVFIDKGESND